LTPGHIKTSCLAIFGTWPTAVDVANAPVQPIDFEFLSAFVHVSNLNYHQLQGRLAVPAIAACSCGVAAQNRATLRIVPNVHTGCILHHPRPDAIITAIGFLTIKITIMISGHVALIQCFLPT
jgi:hypothetical protein